MPRANRTRGRGPTALRAAPILDADDVEIFLSLSIPEPTTGCHLWLGAMGYDYGLFCVRGQQRPAHRIAVLVDGQPWPLGKWVCHRCDNPACVNPRHLYVGDIATNTLDRVRAGPLFWRVGGGDIAASLIARRVRGDATVKRGARHAR